MEEHANKEEIDKLIKSLEQLSDFFAGEFDIEEMNEIDTMLLENQNEFIKMVENQNAKWIDIYPKIKNEFCKKMIKELTEKNFIAIDEGYENIKEIKNRIEKNKKML